MQKNSKSNISGIRRELIAGRMERYGLNNKEIAVKLQMGLTKWSLLKKDPTGLDIIQVERLAQVLHWSDEEKFLFITGCPFEDAFCAKAKQLGLNNLIVRGA